MPAVRGLLDVLDGIAGGENEMKCAGTMRYGVWRDRGLASILAVVESDPDIDAYEREREQTAARRGYRPDVAHWALQGVWQKRRYAGLEREVARARPALVADYERRFRLDAAHAGRLAEYHLQRLIEAYTLDGSDLSYVSACFDLGDLDAYLASGRAPEKVCYHHQFLDPARGATLRRLLGLAIVGDYPMAAVERLIADGAQLDPSGPAFPHELQESPLMLAAKRADVIDALLTAGADPNRGNAFGKTALMYAVQERNLAGVRRLLAGGAEVDAVTDDLEDQDCLALKAGVRTALMYAAWHGTPAIVRALLDAGADRLRVDSEGETAAAYLDRNRSLSATERRALRARLGTGG